MASKLASDLLNGNALISVCCVGRQGRFRILSKLSGDISIDPSIGNGILHSSAVIRPGVPPRALRSLKYRKTEKPGDIYTFIVG